MNTRIALSLKSTLLVAAMLALPVAQAMTQAEYDSGKDAARTKARVVNAEGAYAIAQEKCDSLSGDAKGACIAAARAQFGKS